MMNINMLFEICQNLTRSDWKFIDYLVQEKEKELKLAFRFIQDSIEKKDHQISLSIFHNKVYPALKYRKQRLNKLLAQMEGVLTRVLAFSSLSQNEVLQDRLKISWLGDMGLESAMMEQHREMNEKLAEATTLSVSKIHDFTIANLDFFWIDLKQRNDLNAALTGSVIDQLQYYIIVEALSLELSQVDLEAHTGRRMAFPLGDLLFSQLDHMPSKDRPLVQLLKLAILIQSEKASARDYSTYEKLLYEHAAHMGKRMGNFLFTLKVNYQIRRYNKDQSKANLTALYATYQKMIQEELILWQNVLSYHTYLNVVTTSLKCRDYDYCLEFIEHYKAYLSEEHRANSYALNMAKWHFAKGNYSEALRYNLLVRFKETNSFFASKRVSVCIYYKLKEWKALNLLLNSLQKYAYRKEDNSYHTNIRKNYITNVKLLLKLRYTDSPEKRKAIIDQIKSNPSDDHTWICAEAEALL